MISEATRLRAVRVSRDALAANMNDPAPTPYKSALQVVQALAEAGLLKEQT